MTTAVSLASHGEFARSARTQPAGLAIALVAATLFWLGAHEAVTGSRLMWLVGSALTARVWWVAAGVTLLAWLYKLLTWAG